jgi:gamma-tubulin complex component 2
MLTQRMLNFLQNYLYYVTNEVIEPHWDKLNLHMDGARSVDELIDFHDAFLESSMKGSMLFSPKILKRLERLRAAAVRFARDIARFVDNVERAIGDSINATNALDALGDEVDAVLSDADSQFTQLLGDLLNTMNDAGDVDMNLTSLCSRLDFNGFYSN